jgi:hypothetical protein
MEAVTNEQTMNESMRPWLPSTLARRGFTVDNVGDLSYILLDEIVGGVVTFLVHPWPIADQLGRVRFAGFDRQVEVTANLPDVQRLLYRRFRRRDPRPGDVFACVLRPPALRELHEGEEVLDLEAAVDGMVYDISAEARLVAKLAFYGSLSMIVPQAKAVEWGLPAPESDPSGPAPAREIGQSR